MGFGRDLGAALTFGLSATTKQKEAERQHALRQRKHQRIISSYEEAQERCRAALEDMDASFTAAQEVLMASGALVIDAEDRVVLGWYTPDDGTGDLESQPDFKRSAMAAVPAFGIGIATPAAIWTMVGIYGTASTGVAIGSLSGAAASAATAAWIGRAATLGLGGGMTAGRIALGPIGLAASLLTVPIGAAVAGNNERNYVRRASELQGQMDKLESIYEACHKTMADLQPRMAVTTANLQRHTSQLETATPKSQEAQDAARKLDADMREAATIKDELIKAIEKRDSEFRESGYLDDEDIEE